MHKVRLILLEAHLEAAVSEMELETGAEAADDETPQLVSGLGLLVLFVSVAIVIIIIAVVISKMKSKQSQQTKNSTTEQETEETPDPYTQAVQFPKEEKHWHRQLKTSIKHAGQRILGKGDPPHRTTVPDNLRPQLKHIYVY